MAQLSIMENIILLPTDEQKKRINKLRQAMKDCNIGSALISSNANLYYLTGRVFSGYVYIPAGDEEPVYIIKRPVHLQGERVVNIHKPENIIEELDKLGIEVQDTTALELNRLTYNAAQRLASAMKSSALVDVGNALNIARSTKTDYELDMQRKSGIKHQRVYSRIPTLYVPDMTDLELQIEIERLSRLEGSLGQFRIAGEDMEIYMGNVLVGENADAPSPYDFAMGGAGIDPSIPVGANGTIIKPGMVVMVDMNGNFTGYMTDMTRCFAVGKIEQKAQDAYNLSVEICHELSRLGRPGVEAKTLYDKASEMAKEAGLEAYFMGHKQHAGFVGHGVGIEVNEWPVLAPRSKNILQPNNVIAIEPKFVIPEVGAVGIENTYIVKESGDMECITNASEKLINLDL